MVAVLVLILKIIALGLVVIGNIWVYREYRNAPLMDDAGCPIPTPKEGRRSAGP